MRTLIIAMAFLKGCLSPQVIEKAIELEESVVEEEFNINLSDKEEESKEKK